MGPCSDPLLRFVDLSGAVVGLADTVTSITPATSTDPTAPTDAVTPAEPGWQVLAQTSDLSPVILHKEGQNQRIVAADFNPAQTDLVNRSAFPLFVTNVMNAFRDETPLVLGEPLPPGATLRVGERDVPRAQATEPGLYTLGGQTYAASLFSSAESQLAAFGATTPSAEPEQSSRRVRDAALWLVALALLFLVLEWLLWSRGRRRPWRFRWFGVRMRR